jgi:hypothetical protein
MADTPDLGSGPARGGGSSPLSRTKVGFLKFRREAAWFGHSRQAWKNGSAIMPGKVPQFGIELRIGPVCLNDGSFQVVQVHRQRDPAEVVKAFSRQRINVSVS